MAGIYIHVPFCKQACNYCNFYFSTSTFFLKDYVDALCKEIYLQKNYLNNTPIDSIYFGGGTPSILPTDDLSMVIEFIYKTFKVAKDAEFTLEANPDDLTKDYIFSIKKLGINRLSVGIQSFFDTDLKYMNRAHNAEEAHRCLQWITDAGFDNTTIDLIYGVPTQRATQWVENLNFVDEYKIKHLSAYALTVEEKTPLYFLIRKGKYPHVDDAQALQNFTEIQKWCKKNDWLHYEISNLAASASSISKHNTAYWQRKTYLGLGPSAHSFNGVSRQWNIASIKKYIDGLKENTLLFEQESLHKKDAFNEYVMTSLRTMWGIDLLYIKEHFPDYYAHTLSVFNSLDRRFIAKRNHTIVLTDNGLFYADGLASSFFVV